MPAAVAMFTEEVGMSPVAHGGGPAYRARLAEIVRTGRALGVVEEGRLIFKAEVGSATARRLPDPGRLGRPRTARARARRRRAWPPSSTHARAHIAPIVSLYVNDYNHVAVGTYLRVGFQTVGTFATILF